MRIKILYLSFLLLFAFTAQGQISKNKNLYLVKAEGNDKLKVRMFADYDRIEKNGEFTLVFYFDLNYPWYTYSETPSPNHLPLTIELQLPEGFQIVSRHRDKPDIEKDPTTDEKNELYKSDFCIFYTIHTAREVKDTHLLTASIRWQCCDKTICTMGNATTRLSLTGGKAKKSKLYTDIVKHLNKIQE